MPDHTNYFLLLVHVATQFADADSIRKNGIPACAMAAQRAPCADLRFFQMRGLAPLAGPIYLPE